MTDQKRVKQSHFLLLAVLLLGFALRITAVNFGLSEIYHADEPIVVNHALAYGSGDFNPHFFKIPPLISYLLFICYGIFFVIGRVFSFFKSLSGFELLFYSNPTSFYLIARIIFGVFLGTFTIYVFYNLILNFFDRTRALLCALFFAVCFLHVRDSHYVYVDIPLVLVLVASFFTIFRILKGDSSRLSAIQMGIWIGLATAIKYNGAVLVIPYFTSCFFNPKARKGIFITAIVSLLTFYILNPFSLLDYSFFFKEIVQQSKSQSGVPWFHHFIYSLNGSLGPVLLILSCISMIRVVFRPGPFKSVVLLFCVAYYGILILAGQPYDRYVLPLLPFLIFLAADLIAEIKNIWLIALLSLVSIFFPLGKSILWDRIMLQPDVRTVAHDWIEANLPENSRVAIDYEFHAPRLQFNEAQLKEKEKNVSGYRKRRVEGYLKALKHPTYELYFLTEDPSIPRFLLAEPAISRNLAALDGKKIDYVIVPVRKSGDIFLEELEKRGTLIKSFSPYRNSGNREVYDPEPLTAGPFVLKDLLARERNGVPILIFKIR